MKTKKRHFIECWSFVVGKWAVEQLKENKVPGDQGLVLKSRAKHHAIAAMLAKPFVFKDEPLVIQWVLPCFSSSLPQLGAVCYLHFSSSVTCKIISFCDRVADMRWIFKMVSTVAEHISNCFQTLAVSVWWVQMVTCIETPLRRRFFSHEYYCTFVFVRNKSLKLLEEPSTTPWCLKESRAKAIETKSELPLLTNTVGKLWS